MQKTMIENINRKDTEGHMIEMKNREDTEGHMIEMQTASPRRLRRLGIVMEPNPGDLREAEGVLNPAVARGPDGELYLLPRLVAPGNYSRIGLARVVFDQH